MSRITTNSRYKHDTSTTDFNGKQTTSSCTRSEITDSVGSTEINIILKKFVEYFVKEFETKLRAYHQISENEIKIPTGNTFTEKIGQGIFGAAGGAIGYFLGSPSAGANVGSKIGKEAHNVIFGKIRKAQYVTKLTSLGDMIDYSQESKDGFRATLVEAAFDIFQSFEMQFSRVSSDFGSKGAMYLLAKDAANRAIKHLTQSKHTPAISIGEAVILGESKIQPVLGVPVPTCRLKAPGCDIRYEYLSCSQKWNTASLYEKSGVVKDTYYKKKDGSSKTSKYGYRRLLTGEDWSKLKQEYILDNVAESQSGQFVDFTYTLPKENSEQWSLCTSQLLDGLNSMDESLGEERTKEVILEVRDVLLEEIKGLKPLCQEHHVREYALLGKIEKNLETLKIDDYFQSVVRYLEGTKMDIILYMKEGQKQNRQGFERIQKTVEGIAKDVFRTERAHDKMSDDVQSREKEREPVWFNVKSPVRLFTGRKEELKILHESVQRCEDGTVVSRMTVVCGLGGIGKTELVKKYAHNHVLDYDGNVIWIEAESRDTLSECFHDLCENELHINLNDINGKQRTQRSIVKEVYKHFTRCKSLFIFNNVENIHDLHNFLPLDCLPPHGNKPYILITSRNREWEAGIQVIPLTGLGLGDAMKLIKRGLGKTEKCDPEDKELRDLAKKLQGFPLALHQAIAYIVYQAQTMKYGVREYLKEYEEKAKDLLDFEGFMGIDNTYQKTTYTTWKITTEKIRRDSPCGSVALEMLYYMAYLEPDRIRKDLLSFVADTATLNSAVRMLINYSLVNGKKKQSVLNIHRLVQQVTRLDLDENGREFEILHQLMNGIICLEFHFCGHEVFDLFQEIFLSAQSVGVYFIKHEDLRRQWGTFMEIVNENYNLASGWASLLLGLKDATVTLDYKMSMLVRILLGSEYLDALPKISCSFGERDDKLLFFEALEIFKNVNRGFYYDNVSFPLPCADRTSGCSEHEKHMESLEVYRAALAKTKANTDPHEALLTLKLIALRLTSEGLYGEAIEIYKVVYEKEQSILKPDDPAIIATLRLMFKLHENCKLDEDALNAFLYVLEKAARTLSTDRALTLEIMTETIVVLLHLRRYSEALEASEELLELGLSCCISATEMLAYRCQAVPLTEGDATAEKKLMTFFKKFSCLPLSPEGAEKILIGFSPLKQYDRVFGTFADFLRSANKHPDLDSEFYEVTLFVLDNIKKMPKFPCVLTATVLFFSLLKTEGDWKPNPEVLDEKYGFGIPRCWDIDLKYGLHVIRMLKQTLGPNYCSTLNAIKNLSSCNQFIRVIKDIL